jgi:hypothetical protein
MRNNIKEWITNVTAVTQIKTLPVSPVVCISTEAVFQT